MRPPFRRCQRGENHQALPQRVRDPGRLEEDTPDRIPDTAGRTKDRYPPDSRRLHEEQIPQKTDPQGPRGVLHTEDMRGARPQERDRRTEAPAPDPGADDGVLEEGDHLDGQAGQGPRDSQQEDAQRAETEERYRRLPHARQDHQVRGAPGQAGAGAAEEGVQRRSDVVVAPGGAGEAEAAGDAEVQRASDTESWHAGDAKGYRAGDA